jgi:dolichyl-phosphate-mannose-protein mannosyltransferase
MRSALLWLSLCGIVAASGAFHGLGQRPLLDAESRYALVGLEMLRSGDWIQPRLNTFPYYEKPPLLYWTIAASYYAFGVNEFASRLPSALAHVGTTLLVFALASTLAGRGAAAFASLIYATAVGPVTYARYSFSDGLLIFWLTLSLFGLALTLRGKAGWLMFYIGAAGAVLSKGFIGVVFPFATVAVYVLATRDLGLVARLRPGFGVLVLLGLVLPWHVALAVRDPAFVRFYIVNEHIYRFLNVREPIDYVPLSVAGFWLDTLFWLLPWSILLPAVLVGHRLTASVTLPVIWSMVVVGFFSLAQSRLERYGLPALPAVAIIVGVYWQHFSEHPGRRAALMSLALLLLTAGVALTAMAFLMPVEGAAFTRLVAALDGHYREHPDQALLFAGDAARIAQPSSLLLVACGVGTLLTARMARARLTFVVWLVFLVPALLFVDRGTRLLTVNRSQRDAAEIINSHWEDGARIVVAGPYDDAMSVTFYTERPTYLLDGNSTDLAFGIRHAVGSPLVLTDVQLETLWRSPHRLFLLTNQPPPAGASVLLDRPTYRLVTNRPLTSRVRPIAPSASSPDRRRSRA